MITVFNLWVKYPSKISLFLLFSFLLFIFLLRGSKENCLSRLWVFCQCLISLPWDLFSIASDCNIAIFMREQNLVIETWWSWHWWKHSFLWVMLGPRLCLCVMLWTSHWAVQVFIKIPALPQNYCLQTHTHIVCHSLTCWEMPFISEINRYRAPLSLQRARDINKCHGESIFLSTALPVYFHFLFLPCSVFLPLCTLEKNRSR